MPTKGPDWRRHAVTSDPPWGIEVQWLCRFKDGTLSEGWSDRAEVETAIRQGLRWNDDPANTAVEAVSRWRYAPSPWFDGEPPSVAEPKQDADCVCTPEQCAGFSGDCPFCARQGAFERCPKVPVRPSVESTKTRNARLVDESQPSGCQGDGEVRCLRCGAELDGDSAAEMREGLCWEHLPEGVSS